MRFVLLSLALVASLGACRTDRDARLDRARAYVASHGELDGATAGAIASGRLAAGMTKDQVRAAWGDPVIVERASGGAVEYWYFDCVWPHHCVDTDMSTQERYVSRALFRDGRLVSWED